MLAGSNGMLALSDKRIMLCDSVCPQDSLDNLYIYNSEDNSKNPTLELAGLKLHGLNVDAVAALVISR